MDAPDLASIGQVNEYLESLAELIGDQDPRHGLIVERVQRLRSRLFNLVVMGLFKRGKSTTINAIVGAEVLPTGVLPVTAIGTILTYGETPLAIIRFLNGTSKEVPVDQIADYVTERENPRNAKAVESVEVHIPSAFLRQGVRIIDTPGTGSTFEHNSAVAREWIPRADAIVFVLSVDPPISQEEVHFLKEIRQHAAKLFFILNKIDYLDPKQIEEAVTFTRHILTEQACIENPSVFPVSARNALSAQISRDEELLSKSGFTSLKRALERFLSKDTEKVMVGSAARMALTLIGGLEFELKVLIKALDSSEEELAKNTALFKKRAESMRRRKSELLYLLKGEAQELTGEIEAHLEELASTNIPRLREKVEEEANRRKHLPVGSLEEFLKGMIESNIQEVFEEFRHREQEWIEARLSELKRRFSDETNDVIREIRSVASEIFNVPVENQYEVLELPERLDFYYKFQEPPGLLSSLTLGLERFLPRPLARKRVIERMQFYAGEMFDRQRGRVRHDFAARTEELLDQIRSTLENKIDATIRALEESLDSAIEARNSRLAGEKHGEAEKRLKRLQELREKFQNFSNL